MIVSELLFGIGNDEFLIARFFFHFTHISLFIFNKNV